MLLVIADYFRTLAEKMYPFYEARTLDFARGCSIIQNHSDWALAILTLLYLVILELNHLFCFTSASFKIDTGTERRS